VKERKAAIMPRQLGPLHVLLDGEDVFEALHIVLQFFIEVSQTSAV
jgi:hypothetical protein